MLDSFYALDSFTQIALAAAAGVAALGILIMIGRVLWSRGRRKPDVERRDKAIVHPCGVCGREMVFSPNQLVPLTGVEAGLVVSARPDLHGKKLAEYICPYCETAHCFTLEGRRTVWVDANIFVPEQKRARCMECLKALRRPAWPAGTYDGRLNEAPELHPDLGLQCPRCKAVVCVQCCQNNTRGEFTGVYRCPRCSARAVDRTFHA